MASALLEELSADLPTAGSDIDLIVASHQDATLTTVREWVQSGVVPAPETRVCTDEEGHAVIAGPPPLVMDEIPSQFPPNGPEGPHTYRQAVPDPREPPTQPISKPTFPHMSYRAERSPLRWD